MGNQQHARRSDVIDALFCILSYSMFCAVIHPFIQSGVDNLAFDVQSSLIGLRLLALCVMSESINIQLYKTPDVTEYDRAAQRAGIERGRLKNVRRQDLGAACRWVK